MEHQLLDNFLNGHATEVDLRRVQLIRVLSRSGTLPKVSNLHVQYIHSQPEMFLMQPGKQLRIGVRLLQHPILALVALRYGIEWHIWYNAVKKVDDDCRVADLAAARVAVKFIDLLPEDDRRALHEDFPEDLKSLYSFFRSAEFDFGKHEKIDLSAINKFHKLEAPNRPINKAWLSCIENLAVPTEALLMSGGDVRLNVEPKHLLNVYGCRPFPRPEAFTFASSTATSISNIAFDLTQKQREKLIRDSFKEGLHVAYEKLQSDLINRLRISLNLGRQANLVLAASGTDISLLVAGVAQALSKKPVHHVLVASDETGSGVPLALSGKHFANSSALGSQVQKESVISGFEISQLVRIPLRDASGVLNSKQSMDEAVAHAVEEAEKAGAYVVLHVMDQSKLGYAAPTLDLLENIRRQYGDDVLVLIDNSQLRMDTERIANYLKQGFLMTVTGSKFYTGPPFSGALVIPEKLNSRIQKAQGTLPKGLIDYFLKSDCSALGPIAEHLSEGINIGSFLRWYAALVEIERYYRTPITLRNLGTELFCDYVARRIEQTDCLEALEQANSEANHPIAEGIRMIYPFFIKHEGRVLTHPEADQLYRLLNQDISALIPNAADEDLRIARQACHIGQPVKVIYKDGTPSAVVRISLGSRVIAESWKDRDVSLFFQRIESQMNQVDAVIKKIRLILQSSLLSN
jgi:hypothetical protein